MSVRTQRYYTEIMVPLPANHGKYSIHKHCERVTIDPNCFTHKHYPTCPCGRKYLPKLGCLKCRKLIN